MLLRVNHETKLSYSAPVSETVFEVRMGPMSDEDQTTLGYRLRVAPTAPVTAYRDGFGNRVDLFNLPTPHREVVVSATSFVRTHRRPAHARLAEVAWPGERPISVEALEFLGPSPLVDEGPALDAFRAALPEPSGSLADMAIGPDGGRRCGPEVREAGDDGPDPRERGPATWAAGVCQDSSISSWPPAGASGLPARYVSGYICQAGELATHAWCQVWAGRAAGWVDIDPTRKVFANDDYVVTAVGRDYSDVPPNRGLWQGRAEETIAVTVTVEPADRMPADWYELGPQTPWSDSAGQFQSQSQRSGNGGASQSQRQGQGRGNNGNGLSHQGTRAGYRHQQSQQQQQ